MPEKELRMDIDYVVNTLASQSTSVQASAGQLALKKSLDSERDSVLTILGVPSQANLQSGVGGNLDVSA
jgi:hypothetical protein